MRTRQTTQPPVTVDRITASMPPELSARIRAQADRESRSISSMIVHMAVTYLYDNEPRS